MSNNTVLTTDQIASPEKPSVSKELAVQLAHKHFGIRAFRVEEYIVNYNTLS